MKNEQQAGGEVPEWALEMARQKGIALGMPDDKQLPNGPYARPLLNAFARYIAAHEPAPVEPLAAVLDELRHELPNARTDNWHFLAADFLRNRLPQAALDALGGGK